MDKFTKPVLPYVVVEPQTSKRKLFSNLDDAECYGISLSKAKSEIVYVLKTVKLDGYRCIIESTYKSGIYSDFTKGEILLHYLYFYLCDELDM